MYLAGFEEILEAVLARLGRFVEARDRADLLAPAGVRDAQALMTAVLRAAPDADPPEESLARAASAAGLLYYGRQLVQDDEDDRDEATRLLELARSRGGGDLADERADLRDAVSAKPVPGPADQLDGLNLRAAMTPAGTPLAQLDECAALLRRALAAADEDLDPRMYESNLIGLLERRYGRTGHEDDLREATALSESLVERTEDEHPAYAGRISQLALLEQMVFAQTGDAATLDAAVDRLREAARHTPPGHEDHAMRLSNLGRARKLRYQTTRPEPEEIAAAVALLEQAVAATPRDDPHAAQATRRGELAAALALHYRETDDVAHLEAAIRCAHEAWRLTPRGDHNIPERLQDLAVVHMLRYRVTGDRADKRTAIKAARGLRRAVPKGHPLHDAAEMLLNEL
ncbi:hypothetical protein BZB76_2163 [Actinomadura pelletieri DSM 43383]|uniref:Tetratricopeptide repeat protein n=1 Tax=Actinomadura pelletieri DSM 43383 TaxID=1120940 RepID=A0A495QTP5_9ACTN|nr:hypothetical protein [Actinomadura pelletieri]RKS76801.1 hypothetical protein BZB76_2163 [Actinomadura pelletieri DSM 43383]